MFLADTNTISELRKGARADPGVVTMFRGAEQQIFLPVMLIGEVRFGIERLRRKGDLPQAQRVEEWFQSIVKEYLLRILDFDLQCAKMWGFLMGVNDQHIVDRQIAAIALVYDLTLLTRNTAHFAGTGVRLLNPFTHDASVVPPIH
jgi:predicted nucleic acid-binding protein